jgi:hypothetical protein
MNILIPSLLLPQHNSLHWGGHIHPSYPHKIITSSQYNEKPIHPQFASSPAFNSIESVWVALLHRFQPNSTRACAACDNARNGLVSMGRGSSWSINSVGVLRNVLQIGFALRQVPFNNSSTLGSSHIPSCQGSLMDNTTSCYLSTNRRKIQVWSLGTCSWVLHPAWYAPFTAVCFFANVALTQGRRQ